MNELFVGYLSFEKGIVKIQGNNEYITNLDFVDKEENENLNEIILECKKQLMQYLKGERKEFTIKTRFTKGTEFQQKVWNELTNIPYGQTATYKDVAVRIGNDKASRAIGGANNKNPISIIFP